MSKHYVVVGFIVLTLVFCYRFVFHCIAFANSIPLLGILVQRDLTLIVLLRLSFMQCFHRQVDGNDLDHTSPPSADLPSCTSETPLTCAELDARLAQYQQRGEEDEEEEERAPDLQKDDMMARRTGVFHRQSTMTYNRFLPLPTSVRGTQGEVTVDAAPRSKKEVQADRSKMLKSRWAGIGVERCNRRRRH